MSNQTLQSIEAETILATAPPLFLEMVNDISEMKQLYTKLADPLCTRLPSAPKSRKRTVAELAADEALAAEQQKFMLVMDERLAPSSTTATTSKTTVADAEANSNATEARFERFKVLEDIKDSLREKKERENEARLLQQQQQSLAAQQQQVQIRTKMEQERLMQEAAKARENQVKKQELLRNHSGQSVQQQATPQPQHQGSPIQMPATTGQHGHPTPNNSVLANAQQLAASQTAHSSPAVRHATPQNMPSPAMSNMISRPQGTPMVMSGSNQGVGSPPRPTSAVPHGHAAGIPMIPQRSQQPPSRNGTPAMVNGTPRMQQATPIMRNVTPTPRMTQGSPMSHASATPMMANGMLGAAHMNGQPHLTPQQQQQIYMQQQQQQQQARQAQMMQAVRERAMQGGPTQVMTPQQMQAMAAVQAQAQARQQQSVQEAYRANMQAMQQQMQQHSGHPMVNGMMMNQVQQGNQPQMSNEMILRRNFAILYKKLLTEFHNVLKNQFGSDANIPPQQLQNAKQRAMQQAHTALNEQQRHRAALMAQQQQAQQQQQQQHQQHQHQAALFAQMQRNGQINGQLNGGMGGMGNMGGM